MKIGYYTHTDISISESFIYSLLSGLEDKVGSENIVHFIGASRGHTVIKNSEFTHFRLHNRFTKVIEELNERTKLAPNLSIRLKKRWVHNKLKDSHSKYDIDVAFVDYGQASVILRDYFVKRNIPFVVQFHGFDANKAFNSSIYHREIKKVFQDASYIVVASFFLKRLLILRGCPEEKIQVVRYGIDCRNMVPIPWSERIKNPPSIVFLGRFTEKKNPVALLYAFDIVKRSIPKASLTLIGDGDLMPEVKRVISTLGLESSVKLLGSLEQDEAYKEIRKYWIYAQHSVTATSGDQEGCAISPGEAAGFELPVVSTIHNGIPEYVEDGKTGYLVREFDYVTMGERIIDLINNPDVAGEMGRSGRAVIQKMNDPKIRLDSIHNLLSQAFTGTQK